MFHKLVYGTSRFSAAFLQSTNNIPYAEFLREKQNKSVLVQVFRNSPRLPYGMLWPGILRNAKRNTCHWTRERRLSNTCLETSSVRDSVQVQIDLSANMMSTVHWSSCLSDLNLAKIRMWLRVVRSFRYCRRASVAKTAPRTVRSIGTASCSLQTLDR